MNKTIGAALLLAVGLGTVGARALDLKGSDTLRQLTTDLIQICPGTTLASGGTQNLVYKGGGSGVGETALVLGQQSVAPMSRFLAAATGTSGVCGAADPSKSESIAFAADGIGVWFDKGASGTGARDKCDPGQATDTCQSYQNGGISYRRTLSCGVTLTSWKDVLRLIYFGLRPADFSLPTSPADPNAEVSPAAIARRDCRDTCRDELRNNFGKLFQNDCAAGSGTACTKLQHAFRRDEQSGTTDFFRETLNVEAGANIGNKGFPFCNEYVPRVTINVASVPSTTHGNPTTCTGGPNLRGTCAQTFICSAASGGTCGRINNGCVFNDDCPSGSVCDPGQNQCIKTCTTATDCSALDVPASTGTAKPAKCVNLPLLTRTQGTLSGDAGGSNVCVHEVDGCVADSDCQSGFLCDLNANGGTCSPACTPGTAGDATCAAYLPSATCTTPAGASGAMCTRSFGSICPVPGLVARGANTVQPSWGGPVAGALGVARAVIGGANAVGFENQQDNDLLRWAAIGTFNVSSSSGQPADENSPVATEQVASACSDLGLVLPISEPAADPSLATDPAVFPTAICGVGAFSFANATKLQAGGTSLYGLCPNGSMPDPGGSTWDAATRTVVSTGTGSCLHPQVKVTPPAVAFDFHCLNGKNSKPNPGNFPPAADLPLFTNTLFDGRVYNLHLMGANSGNTTAHASQSYGYVAGAQPPVPPAGETEVTFTESVISAFFRVHTTRTARSGADAKCAAGACCTKASDTQQIGCLVQASPCSMGFSGLQAGEVSLVTGTTSTTAQSTFAAGLNNKANTTCTTDANCSAVTGSTCIGNICTKACTATADCSGLGSEYICSFGQCVLVDNVSPSPLDVASCLAPPASGKQQYAIARDLWIGSTSGFGAGSAEEGKLVQCFAGTNALSNGTTIGQQAVNHGFVDLTGTRYPFCRSFNESACTIPGSNPPATYGSDTASCSDNPSGYPTLVR